jgi:hypothetical protein
MDIGQRIVGDDLASFCQAGYVAGIEEIAMEMLVFATAAFVAGLLLGSWWQYRRLLRQIYESAHR